MARDKMDMSKIDSKSIENAMRIAKNSLGVDEAKLAKLSSPNELAKMLRKLSEEDMAKLEIVLKNPKSIEKMMTPENTARLKKLLGDK